MLTHEHVTHLAKRNDSLSAKVDKFKARAAKLTGHGVQLLEISAGAVLGGALQGMAKDQEHGPHFFKVPADLAIGLGLNVVAALDVAGKEYSQHLANFGTGFVAAYLTDFGHGIGSRKRLTGSFFKKASAALGTPGVPVLAATTAAAGEFPPSQMADNLLQQMARQG